MLETRLMSSTLRSWYLTLLAVDRGNTTKEGGRESVRNISRTWRFKRCLPDESRITFLGMTTAYPRASSGSTIMKWGDETRRPALRAAGNCSRESRSRRENTGKSGSEARSSYTAALLDDFSTGRRLRSGKKPVGRGALTLFRLIGSFRCHTGWELSCTHDTNSFSTKRQCAGDSE